MNKALLLFVAAVLLVVGLTSFETLYPTGAPAGYTGSPGDGGNNCTSCHGGSPTTSAGWITSNIPGSGYVAGTTYQITATNSLTGSGKFGFEISPQNASGTLLGTLAAGTNSQLIGSGKYITHTNASPSISTWTFNWTAPAAGTGTVTFYGAFARNKPGPVTLSTLVVNEALSAPGAAGPITGPSAVCKTSTESYSISSVSGATSYVWTVPSGASITSGQGTISISVNFSSTAASGNVSVYGTNTAGNGAASNKAITVNSAPSQPSAISGNATACQGSSQIYSVTSMSGVSYSWSVPAGYVITAGQGTNSVTVTLGSASGNISVSGSNTCGLSPASTLAVSPAAIPGTAGTPSGPATVDLGFVTSSQYTTTGTNATFGYAWMLTPVAAGTLSGTGTTVTVNWNSFVGTATLKVQGVGECGEGSWSEAFSIEVLNTTGINDPSQSQVMVYPSPSNGNFTVEVGKSFGAASVSIVDLSGKEVYSLNRLEEARTLLNLPLTKGLYMVIVQVDGITYKKKLIIN
jgi:hypothetical protein